MAKKDKKEKTRNLRLRLKVVVSDKKKLKSVAKELCEVLEKVDYVKSASFGKKKSKKDKKSKDE